MIKLVNICILILTLVSFSSCQASSDETGEALESIADNTNEAHDRPACLLNMSASSIPLSHFAAQCAKADTRQIAEVNEGNTKRDQFLSQCYAYNNNSCWCDQLLRPNPNSIDTFFCTYGETQTHQLIHPDESTWKYAFEAVKIVEEFEEKNIYTQIIYNWWRPEPYNKNVGGSATRHPFGTSIDVRFETKEMQNQAFDELCKMRADGRIRAIGYYTTTAIHLGIGDNRANTWGKSCP